MITPDPIKVVTTSWDDGNIADLRLAELLKARGLNGTFYIPLQYKERSLTDKQLRELGNEGFEVGAHSCSHKMLKGLSSAELLNEVTPCKRVLEDATGSEVRMFCYPCGRYDAAVVRTLRAAGYSGARTTKMLATQLSFSSFEIPTSIQAFPHPAFAYFKNAAKAHKLQRLKTFFSRRDSLANWVHLGKCLFDDVLQQGGVWHLYGHSWEIERLGLWNGLAELLDYVSRRGEVQYVSNSRMLSARGSSAG